MGFLLFMEFGGARSRNGCTARDIQPRAAAKLSYGSCIPEAPHSKASQTARFDDPNLMFCKSRQLG
jgi:hypothetical protein